MFHCIRNTYYNIIKNSSLGSEPKELFKAEQTLSQGLFSFNLNFFCIISIIEILSIPNPRNCKSVSSIGGMMGIFW